MLFHEGDAEDRLYVVITGKIKLGRSGSAGRENLLAILGPGQMFGELSLFDPGPRSTTATAVTACEIRTLEHDELMGWLTGRPEVAQGLLGQLAARLRRANDVVAEFMRDRIREAYSRCAGRDLAISPEVLAQEHAAGDRNRALGYLLASAGIIEGDPTQALEDYFAQCSVLITCRDLALMGALTGLVLGVAQAIALPRGTRRRWIWAAALPVLWALGWTATTLGGIAAFGLSGVVVGPVVGGLFLAGWSIYREERQLANTAAPEGDTALL